ncbi:MAG: hypothetical protein ACRDRL_02650 [Sciscionella sp.]
MVETVVGAQLSAGLRRFAFRLLTVLGLLAAGWALATALGGTASAAEKPLTLLGEPSQPSNMVTTSSDEQSEPVGLFGALSSQNAVLSQVTSVLHTATRTLANTGDTADTLANTVDAATDPVVDTTTVLPAKVSIPVTPGSPSLALPAGIANTPEPPAAASAPPAGHAARAPSAIRRPAAGHPPTPPPHHSITAVTDQHSGAAPPSGSIGADTADRGATPDLPGPLPVPAPSAPGSSCVAGHGEVGAAKSSYAVLPESWTPQSLCATGASTREAARSPLTLPGLPSTSPD